jgi:HD superfamily phosphodiesterase
MNEILIQSASAFVEKYFQENIGSSYLYHNYNHAVDVLNAAKRIISIETPTEIEQDALLLAALFHDTGFSQGSLNHEDRSVEIFGQFAQNSAASIIGLGSTINLSNKRKTCPCRLVRRCYVRC